MSIIHRQTDQDLERRVIERLHRKFVPRRDTLEVRARNGCIIVRGRVESSSDRQLWLHHCRQTPGVAVVFDQIEVIPPHENDSAIPGQ